VFVFFPCFLFVHVFLFIEIGGVMAYDVRLTPPALRCRWVDVDDVHLYQPHQLASDENEPACGAFHCNLTVKQLFGWWNIIFSHANAIEVRCSS
jgi:hypothetical protein